MTRRWTRWPANLLGRLRLAENGCVEYTGHIDREGYGRVSHMSAHRAMYELMIGPIPDGLVIDHLCRNRACVNPGHLEPVTPAENTSRGARANKTHCVNGHEFSPENTRWEKGPRHRKCRICHREADRRYYQRKQAQRGLGYGSDTP